MVLDIFRRVSYKTRGNGARSSIKDRERAKVYLGGNFKKITCWAHIRQVADVSSSLTPATIKQTLKQALQGFCFCKQLLAWRFASGLLCRPEAIDEGDLLRDKPPRKCGEGRVS